MLFAKVDPMDAVFEVGKMVRCKANTRLSVEPQRYDEIAVWTSESHGGRGLHALGILQDYHIHSFSNERGDGDHDEFILDVKVTALVCHPISKEHLRVIRGVRDGTPMSELDEGGYFHAHRKIKPISEDVARFLRSRFI